MSGKLLVLVHIVNCKKKLVTLNIHCRSCSLKLVGKDILSGSNILLLKFGAMRTDSRIPTTDISEPFMLNLPQRPIQSIIYDVRL